MSGPIVRSGPSNSYTQNWDNVFAARPAKAKKKAAATSKPAAPKKKKK